MYRRSRTWLQVCVASARNNHALAIHGAAQLYGDPQECWLAVSGSITDDRQVFQVAVTASFCSS